MKMKQEFNWKLKSFLTFSFPVFKRRIRHPQDILNRLPKEASDRYGYLSLRYNTHVWSRVCSRTEFRESLTILDILDRYVPRAEIRGRCLDIGARKWGYLPGLCAYTQTPWDGVELDPHQRYLTLDTRRAHAEYMLRAYPDSRYICGSLLELDGNYPLITWLLPYLSEESFSASDLPERYFQPQQLLQHAMTLLGPKGRMLIINQGENERDLQATMFEKLGIQVKPLGRIESVFSPYRKTRYGWLIEKADNKQMTSFSEILETLPGVDHIDALELTDETGAVQARIENRPGQAGSLRVYHAVSQPTGFIGPQEAKRALELYAEHSADAETNPGKHPNIDRLFSIIKQGLRLKATSYNKESE